jgi:hypothetical protein
LVETGDTFSSSSALRLFTGDDTVGLEKELPGVFRRLAEVESIDSAILDWGDLLCGTSGFEVMVLSRFGFTV